jgi:hypothetical protein
MKSLVIVASLLVASLAVAEVRPARFDLDAIRDPSTLEVKVLQDWQPSARVEGVRQKLIEITVCEWWPGQKVRLPVTFCAPLAGGPCRNVLLVNMGLSPKLAQPTGAELELLTNHGVGLVMVGMGTLDAMEPRGQIHLGMKQQLLRTQDARFTPAWIWGMSDMRGLTAAIAEKDVFQPVKVLATGGSKRGVGAAVSGIFDDRFTAILPVVAPINGSPGGAYVRGSALLEEAALNDVFMNHPPAGLPSTVSQALEEREQRRMDQSITRGEALVAGWSEADMLRMNEEAWKACQITAHLDAVQQRGLEFFYHNGTNDNVCPGLRLLGETHPDLPICILPGGQHGGPQTTGYTLQTPTQPEVDQNLLAFARHHFFDDRSLPKTPRIEARLVDAKLLVTVHVERDKVPQVNSISWCFDRHLPFTFAAEYDQWDSTALTAGKDGVFTATIDVPATVDTVDVIGTHTHEENGIPFHFSSPYRRWTR